MNELIQLIENLSKGVRKTMRTFFYFILIFLFLISTGWLRLECDGNEILKDVKAVKKNVEKRLITDFHCWN